MKWLEESDPEIWTDFMQGNWVVNKNTIPFCAIGVDHALEQVKAMALSASLIILVLLQSSFL